MQGTIKLMADYGCSPLWLAGGKVGNLPLVDCELDKALYGALRAWARTYDQTLNHDDPAASTFPDEASAAAFETEGRRLWRALQGAFPEVTFVYFSEQDGQLHE